MERNEKKKQRSGAQKRKKKKEKEEAIERARAELERLKLGPTKIWTGSKSLSFFFLSKVSSFLRSQTSCSIIFTPRKKSKFSRTSKW